MKWKPTPKSFLITAKRLDLITGKWIDCLYSDLKAGDIFRAFAGDDNVDPITQEPYEADNIAAYCHADAFRNGQKNQGYWVEVTVAPLPELLKMITN